MAAFLSKAPPAKFKEENIVQTNIKHEEIREVNSAKGNDKEVHKSDQSEVNGRHNEMEVEVLENEKEHSVKNGSSKGSVKNNTAAAKGKKVKFSSHVLMHDQSVRLYSKITFSFLNFNKNVNCNFL